MISARQTLRAAALLSAFSAFGCGFGSGAEDAEVAVIDPPAQCSGDRPDCSRSEDYPTNEDLDVDNSAGIRFSNESSTLVVDRVSALPDIDGDGVPDDADDCPGTPDWISCDDDPSNDGVYATVFYDPSGAPEVVRNVVARTVADIPAIDVYLLIDATTTMSEEIGVLQSSILSIIDDVRSVYGDARFGIGLYRQYAVPPYAPQHTQAPYHHVLDLTDDDALVETALSTLNIVGNTSSATAATQALYSTASGLGLADMVPNRGECPDAENANIGYPCFRPDVLHVVMNITDSEVYNGPRASGDQYASFAPGVGDASTDLPPAQIFPELFAADDVASALDLGDLSGRSLTLLGMSTLLTNQVNTAVAPGCAPPPPPPPTGADMDGKDVVLALRFDTSLLGVNVFANNTHWYAANVALFPDATLDPLTAIACDGGTVGVGMWGAIEWTPTPGQQYYLVADPIVPADPPGLEPQGAFSISIVHDGDPSNGSWLTTEAPVSWDQVEAALAASDIRVASVVTLRAPLVSPSPGRDDAREIALQTDATTKTGGRWVTELGSASGDGLEFAVSNTLELPKTDSVYDISMLDLDNEATPIDERDFVSNVRWNDCAEGEALECGWGSGNRCRRCDVGAPIAFDVLFQNDSVAPEASSQVFDFELLVRANNDFDVERVPVRVMVPDQLAHEYDEAPEAAFYRNSYDTTLRCNTPPERPKWGLLTWDGSTPGDTSIEFQIRTAATESELALVEPAIVRIPDDTTSNSFDITEELIADGQPYGLPYISITAVLTPTNSPPATPTLDGWTFEFVCEAAE
jgi:hypothetical protein